MSLSREQKKEAINQFRERKSTLGVYAVRCNVTGEVWVGPTRNLNAAHNSIWFALRHTAHRDRPLQDAWTAHGEAAFEYQVLEELPEDAPPLLIPDLLKDAKKRWMLELDARGLL